MAHLHYSSLMDLGAPFLLTFSISWTTLDCIIIVFTYNRLSSLLYNHGYDEKGYMCIL